MSARWIRLAAGLACLVAAAFTALLADDLRRWPAAVREGDVQLRLKPARGDPWHEPNRVPFRVAERVLDVDDDLEFRRALRMVVLTRPEFRGISGFGFIPPVDGAGRRFRAIAQGDGPLRDRSAAANFLGVMAYETGGLVDTGYARQALRYFTEAIRLDASNEEAKFNLELLLDRASLPPRSGSGGGSAGRGEIDAEGAGATDAGRGY